jgi:hypothetical protein
LRKGKRRSSALDADYCHGNRFLRKGGNRSNATGQGRVASRANSNSEGELWPGGWWPCRPGPASGPAGPDRRQTEGTETGRAIQGRCLRRDVRRGALEADRAKGRGCGSALAAGGLVGDYERDSQAGGRDEPTLKWRRWLRPFWRWLTVASGAGRSMKAVEGDRKRSPYFHGRMVVSM